MRIVLFTHPPFLPSRSMPRFAGMLCDAYRARGHEVQVWAPRACVHAWATQGLLARWTRRSAKWAGYIDQYLLFPRQVRARLAQQPPDTLYVFADQALGPWAPLVADRPLVVHVHDMLALRSALGEVPENPTRWSGRIYQRWIRRGFGQARHFICVSQRTRDDLLRVGKVQPLSCEVVHNGLNRVWQALPADEAARRLHGAGLPVPPHGMLLHVSGGQWYKNVAGVLRLYAEHARGAAAPLPLWLVGARLGAAERAALAAVPPQGQVLQLPGLAPEVLEAAYAQARALLFPSHAEGFGWPIVEAQACGCPVVTTDDTPMTEVGGPNALYLPRLRIGDDVQAWAAHGAARLQRLLDAGAGEAAARRQAGLDWAARFGADRAIDAYLRIYHDVLRGQVTPLHALPPPRRGAAAPLSEDTT
jgi:glycosyltransferase involved in cell wall biosynthesis